MPIYVYSCPACEIEIEELRPMRDADLPFVCPVCHEWGVRAITSFNLWQSADATAERGGDKRPPRHSGCPCCSVRR